MKNQTIDFCRRFLRPILLLILCFAQHAEAQTPFQIVWGMNGDLNGVSSSSNFTPSGAGLDGAHQHSLPSVRYYSLGGGDYAYGTTYWQAATGVQKYLSFSYGVSAFEYSISSVTFRVRRSGDGPVNVALRSSLDGFASDLAVSSLNTDGIFYNVTVPLGLSNLKTGIEFRLYAYNAGSYQGVLYFDQIVINGNVTSIVLPVQLTYFVGKIAEESVELEWETAMERNSKKFVIERSQDLVEFEPIGTLDAAGESATKIRYSFTDNTPSAGINYYRLRMIDEDASFGFSNIVQILLHTDNPDLAISPNPSSPDRIRIRTDLNEPTNYVLNSASGQRISIFYIQQDGNYVNLFPNHTLSSGFYVLSLKLNGRLIRRKVLVP